VGKLADFFNAQGITLPVQQKQQMLALDKEFESLEFKLTRLEAENLKLRAEVNPLKQEVEKLKNKVEKSGVHDSPTLDEIEVKILRLLSSLRSGANAVTVAANLKISPTKADYYLERMERAKFIHGAHFYNDTPTEYSLIQLGREYLVKHDLA
jgi:hypothetical protein